MTRVRRNGRPLDPGRNGYVYPKETMAELRSWFDRELAARLPACRVLYRT